MQRCYEPESSSGELRAGSFATVRGDPSTRLSVMLSGPSTLEWFAFTGGSTASMGRRPSFIDSRNPILGLSFRADRPTTDRGFIESGVPHFLTVERARSKKNTTGD